MGLCDNAGIGTGEKGCQKVGKGSAYLLWWTAEQEIDISSMQQKPFMEALIYAAQATRMAIMKKANYVEKIAPEITEHKPEFGEKEVMNKDSAGIILKHKSGNGLIRSLTALDGETIHVMIGYDNQIIAGKRSGYDKLKTVKVLVSVIDEVIDGREYKNLDLTFVDDNWNDVKKFIGLEWSLNDLEPLTGVYLSIDSCSVAGNVVIRANDLNDTAITGLTVAGFGLYDDTELAAAVIATPTDNADGTYTAAITSGVTAADIVHATYTGPAVANLFVQVQTDSFTATA